MKPLNQLRVLKAVACVEPGIKVLRQQTQRTPHGSKRTVALAENTTPGTTVFQLGWDKGRVQKKLGTI